MREILLQIPGESSNWICSVLSAFEESSAACISDMLRQVSNGQYLDAIRMAENFILHMEVLFATIDDLEFHFALLNMKGPFQFSFLILLLCLVSCLQGCHMFVKPECCAEKPWSCSLCCRIPKKPVQGEWV